MTTKNLLTILFSILALLISCQKVSEKAPGKDGMPIVFSHEIDPRDNLNPVTEIEVISRW